jgi:hypothetical protein
VVKIVKEKTTKIWLTTDGWTSRGAQGYITIILHSLTTNFEHVNIVLSTIPSNSHTADEYSTEILQVMSTNGIGENVMGLIADNTATMPATVKLIQLEDAHQDFVYGGCVAHLLNLVVKNTLSKVHTNQILIYSGSLSNHTGQV